MEHFSSSIKKFLIFCQKEAFLIFQEMAFFYHKINALHLVTISLIYTNLRKEPGQKFNFFLIFVTNEKFKIFFTKRKIIRPYYFINIYIVYENRAFILMKHIFFNFSVKNFFQPFLYMTYFLLSFF